MHSLIKRCQCCIMFCLFFSAQAGAQKLLGEVELGNQFQFCNEPSIALNPIDAKFEIIATNKSHVFYSKDGGKKFRHKKVKSSMGVYGDPVLLYDKNGQCYFVHLSQDKTKKWGESFDQIVVQKSKKNGRRWNDGTGIGKNGKMHDKAWISIDENEKSKYRGNVYVSWTQFDKYESRNPADSSRILFAYSENEGKNFSAPLIVSDQNGDCLDGDSTMEGATTCSGKNGEVFIAWAGLEKIYLDKSLDGGRTFGKDKIVMDCPEGWNLDVPGFFRTNGLPFIHSNTEGDLYICTAFEENAYNRVFVTESKDNGQSWTKPQAMASADSTHDFMPHAYLDKSTGNYYLIYYRMKNGSVDVILSYRLKGSNEFKNIRINSRSFFAPGKNYFMGDYINVCALGNSIACVWTEPKGISTVVKTRKVLLTQ